MADVFISYASEDRERVRPLAEALQARGFSVWWDRALAAGDDYAKVIERELAAAKVVVVVWTAASTQSAFVRDEAARARDQGRLVPVRLDRTVEIPLGFGSFQAEDFSAWTGGANAPQIQLLEEVIRARLQGRSADGEAVQAKRTRFARRIRLVSILIVAATLLASAASLYVIFGRDASRQESVELGRLLDLVEDGKLTGDQAVTLAQLLEREAFAGLASAPAAMDPARQAADAPIVTHDDMVSAAKEAYAAAAATLLQSPDPAVRSALLMASRAETRAQGLQAMWDLAKTEGPSAAALWRACGSLMTYANDPNAPVVLEQALAANPHEKAVWRLLSYSYAAAGKSNASAGAALIAEGLEAGAEKNWSRASTLLDRSLTYTKEPQVRAFIHGQLGDAAAAREDWSEAERRYSDALQAHQLEKDSAAVSLDAAKLARMQLRRGDAERACATLRAAEQAGVAVADDEKRTACERAAEIAGESD